MAICCLRVDIHNAHTTLRQSIDKLKLGASDILHRAKGFEVHLAYRGDDAHLGTYKVANLLDIATLLSTHLHDKDFVVWLKVLTHSAHNTQGGVEVTGSHQHIIPLREDAIEEVLGRCFTETTRDADNLQMGHRAKTALSIVVVPTSDALFQRTVDSIGKDNPVVQGHQ